MTAGIAGRLPRIFRALARGDDADFTLPSGNTCKVTMRPVVIAVRLRSGGPRIPCPAGNPECGQAPVIW